MARKKKQDTTPDLFAAADSPADKTTQSASTAPSQKAKKAQAAPKKTGEYDASAIEVLEGLEPVRRRPGMYIGGTDNRALHHLFAEVIDNSMDEAVAGHASFIEVELIGDGSLRVADNGRGIPIDPHPKFKDKSALEVIMTTLHAGGKFGNGAYDIRRPSWCRGFGCQYPVRPFERTGGAQQGAV